MMTQEDYIGWRDVLLAGALAAMVLLACGCYSTAFTRTWYRTAELKKPDGTPSGWTVPLQEPMTWTKRSLFRPPHCPDALSSGNAEMDLTPPQQAEAKPKGQPA